VDGLTARQREVLDFIETFYRDSGYAPTMREIQEKFGFASRSTAHMHVVALEEKGYVERVEVRGQAQYVPVVR
jgi:repressor LexA